MRWLQGVIRLKDYNINLNQIQNMKLQRPKQPDWGKQFKIIQRRQDFLKLDLEDTAQTAPKPEVQKKKQKESKKQDILVPKIDIVSRIGRCHNDQGIPLNYIRLASKLNLPKVDRYQLSQVDYRFLLTHQNKYVYGGRKVLTTEFLERAIVQLQQLAGKDSTVLPRDSQKRLRAMVERQYDYLCKMDNFDDMLRVVNTHWKNRRQQLKTPLLRLLWKPNTDDTNHYLAFRPRQKQEKEKKKQLRRQTKPSQEQTIMSLQGLHKQFDDALSIAQRVKMRQTLKLQSLALKMKSFSNQIKYYKEEAPFYPQFNRVQFAKCKESIARMSKMFQSKKVAQQPEQKCEEQTVQDVNTAIVNFIATLCHKSSKINIDTDVIVNSTKPGPSLTSSISQSSATFPTLPIVKDAVSIKPKQQASNIVKFNLTQFKLTNSLIFLERDFEEGKRTRQQSDMDEYKGMDNYFNQRHKNIRSVYFFEEDEEDYKDVRKNTSTNFKKWKDTKV